MYAASYIHINIEQISATKLRKYIRKELQRPKGPQNRIPILVTDSKGLTLRNYCPDFKFPFEHWCIPGARTKKLADLIKERAEKALQRYGKFLIYLWAGTCDITNKCGKEIRIRNKDNTTNENIIKECNRIIKYIEQYGSDVIIKIVDLPVLSREKWNTKHLKKHCIKPSDMVKYKEEDKLLTDQVRDLNKRIWLLRKSTGFEPINTSQFYFRTRGGKKKNNKKKQKD